jgi:CheY-like chemotaxis protein
MLSVAALPTTVRALPPEPFVLLVDDHEPTLWNLQKVLVGEGYSCVATPSATDALSLCNGRRPALVVTDLAMPRLDGHGLACGLKARYPSLPIVLVTGEPVDPATEARYRGTFARQFSKPIDIERFLPAIASLLPPNSHRTGR